MHIDIEQAKKHTLALSGQMQRALESVLPELCKNEPNVKLTQLLDNARPHLMGVCFHYLISPTAEQSLDVRAEALAQTIATDKKNGQLAHLASQTPYAHGQLHKATEAVQQKINKAKEDYEDVVNPKGWNKFFKSDSAWTGLAEAMVVRQWEKELQNIKISVTEEGFNDFASTIAQVLCHRAEQTCALMEAVVATVSNGQDNLLEIAIAPYIQPNIDLRERLESKRQQVDSPIQPPARRPPARNPAQ